MNTDYLADFISAAQELKQTLDNFVDAQRLLSAAVRARDWIQLEAAMSKTEETAQAVNTAEGKRVKAWKALCKSLALPEDISVFRLSVMLPLESRPGLTETYRELRMAGMRARIENHALSNFVSVEGSALAAIMEELYPLRKGRIYGKSGKTRDASGESLLVNTAF